MLYKTASLIMVLIIQLKMPVIELQKLGDIALARNLSLLQWPLCFGIYLAGKNILI
jgi:hypothetical protein